VGQFRVAKSNAHHERCYGRQQQILDLEHYLDVLYRKPGALAGSRPLQQMREPDQKLRNEVFQQQQERRLDASKDYAQNFCGTWSIW
jgi:hypothetical protein